MISLDYRRPCFVKWPRGEVKKAFFHCFACESEPIAPSMMKGGHSGGLLQYPIAIVEFEDGTVHKMNPVAIVFNDGGRFKDYDWTREEKGENDG